MCELYLFRHAYADYKGAAILYTVGINDELMINLMCYHLQQSVEKVLKGFLENTGVSVANTHSIPGLVDMSRNNGSPCIITEWVDNHKFELETWEAKTRYIKDFRVGLTTATEGLSEVKKFLMINGVCNTPLKQVTEEAKKIISTHIPRTDLPKDDFEWNVIYMIKRYKYGIEVKTRPYVDFDLGAYCSMMGIKDIPAEIARLKEVYQTEDINEVKCKLKEALSKFNG